jgi:hypothetical protein
MVNSFGKSDIELSTLAGSFDSPAWAGQWNEGTELHNLLKSLPGCNDETINANSLIMLAYLWCQGSYQDKADCLFSLLNPPGENQDSIGWKDKDWEIILDTIFFIATQWTQDRAALWISNRKRADPGFKWSVENKYEESLVRRAIKAMRLSEEEDKPELTGFIMLLFGYESKLTRAEYDEHIQEDKCIWVFSAAEIRERFANFNNEAVVEEFEDQ